MTHGHDAPRGDPWNAFGYIVAGVLLYGLAGFGLDRWWGSSFMTPVGIMFGAVLGLFMTWQRFKAPPDAHPDPSTAAGPPTSTDSVSHPTEPQR